MSTFTLCFAGTNCWHDESLKDRSKENGSSKELYGRAGYIPVKIYSEIDAPYRKAVIPGPGPAYQHFWKRLWVPCTVGLSPTSWIVGGNNSDSLVGSSMWDLAGHAAAKVVGIPSLGRCSPDSAAMVDPEIRDQMSLARDMIGVNLENTTNTWLGKQPYRFPLNALEVLTTSAHAMEGGGPITKINMIGHSRGAVEAIMCSHDLAVLFPNAEVNIFAIDPVPGLGPWSEEMATLGRTVKNYVGVYSRDETSNGFTAVVPKPRGDDYFDPLAEVSGTSQQIKWPHYHLLYAPGRHGTVGGNQTWDGNAEPKNVRTETAACGELINHLARTCLHMWGTNVPLAQQPSVGSLKSTLLTAAPTYRSIRNFRYPTGSIGGYLAEHGISSKGNADPTAWWYLEDVTGHKRWEPLLGGKVNDRPRGPGLIAWTYLLDLPDQIFTTPNPALDDLWETAPLPSLGSGLTGP